MRWGVVIGGVAVVAAVAVGLRVASNRGASTGVDTALEHLPPGYAATHGAISFNPVTGTASLADLIVTRDGTTVLTAGSVNVSGIGSLVGGWPVRVGHVTLKDVSAPPLVKHADRVEADGLETGTLRALIDPAAYPGGKPAWTDRRPALGSLELFGLLLHVDPPPGRDMKPYDVSVKHEHVSDVSARQFYAVPTPDAVRQHAFVADALRAVAFGSEGSDDVAADIPDGGTLHVGANTISHYDGGKIGEYAISDVSFVGSKKPGLVSLGKLDLTGIDTTRLIDQLATLPSPSPAAPPRKFLNALRVQGISLADLKADIPHAPLFKIASIDSHTVSTEGDFSTSGGTMRDFDIITTGRDLPPAATQGLQNFGMQDFSMDLDGEGSFDRGTGHFIAKHEDFKFRGLGTLHVTADIDGLKTDVAPDAPDAAPFHTARLIHAELTWDDASLVGRLFHLAALRSGQSEDALRATMAIPLAAAVAYFPEQPDIADQLNAFLDGRHSLTVTLAPPAPVLFTDVAAAPPNEKAQMLGVTVKGN